MSLYRKYPSITNSYNEKFLNEVRDATFSSDWYYVTEKLHGANFSFVVDYTREITHCSRNREINEDESFHDHKSLNRYHSQILKMYDELTTFDNSILRIYGEYAGSGIQKGIDYGDKDFYCFDISVDGIYLDLKDVRNLCWDFDIKTTPFITLANLEDSLAWSNEFDSLVLKKLDNVCEGIVISPARPIFLRNGDRVILKSKNEKYAEKASRRKIKKPLVPMSETDSASLEILLQYLTQNRVDAVISKETYSNFGKLLGAVAKDALSDCSKENPILFDNSVTKAFNKHVAEFIRPSFIRMINT